MCDNLLLARPDNFNNSGPMLDSETIDLKIYANLLDSYLSLL